MKPAAHLVGVLAVLVLPGCSDKSRRLSEMEAIQYKQKLVREHPGEISPLKLNEFMMVPVRTQGEIDAKFDAYRDDFAAQTAREKAEHEAARKEAASGEDKESGEEP